MDLTAEEITQSDQQRKQLGKQTRQIHNETEPWGPVGL